MNRYKSLKSLLDRMDTIEGTTEGGRHFKIEFNQSTEVFYTQIFNNADEVFEPSLRMVDVLNNNILSTINKIDESFFNRQSSKWGSTISKSRRKNIIIEGKQLENPFTVQISIQNNFIGGELKLLGLRHAISIIGSVPDHIPINQKHNWLYLHYQKQEVLLELLKFNIKNTFITCCGNNILGKHNYCVSCGKEQVVNGLKIFKVVGTELLTKLS